MNIYCVHWANAMLNLMNTALVVSRHSVIDTRGPKKQETSIAVLKLQVEY